MWHRYNWYGISWGLIFGPGSFLGVVVNYKLYGKGGGRFEQIASVTFTAPN